MFVDDQPGPELDGADSPMFTADGGIRYIGLRRDVALLMKDGVPSSTGLRPAVLSESGDSYLQSADNAHVAWIGLTGGNKGHPVFDDEVGPRYDLVFFCLFMNGREPRWWGLRDSSVYQITHE